MDLITAFMNTAFSSCQDFIFQISKYSKYETRNWQSGMSLGTNI